MSPLDQSKSDSKSKSRPEVVKFGSLGVYADDPSQVWGVLLTFFTFFIWFVYINNDLGDLVFRSILIVGLFALGTILMFKFWLLFHRRIWRRIWRW